MVVVAIIGFLAAIATPNFIKARQQSRTSACINNLRLIESAKEQLALEINLSDGDAIANGSDLDNYLRGGFAATRCPASGAADYTVNAIGTAPDCDNFDAGTHNAFL